MKVRRPDFIIRDIRTAIITDHTRTNMSMQPGRMYC